MADSAKERIIKRLDAEWLEIMNSDKYDVPFKLGWIAACGGAIDIVREELED